MTAVKICGLTNLEDAQKALTLGATFLGFIVEVPISKDSITRKEAKEIISKLPHEAKCVYVTHEKNANKIIEIAEFIKPHLIQLHSDIPIEQIKIIKKSLPDIELIKAIHVTGSESLNKAKRYEKIVDFILLDSKSGKLIGGTGKIHDWQISKKIVQEINKPVILAGGLNPDNVRNAVNTVRPFGVDTNSGVKAKDRKKDYEKMRNFIEEARSY